jgi:hypothetical protein
VTIGSAAEEEYNSLGTNIKYQWKQLFPDHLMDYVMEYPDKKLINIIISPDKSFKNDDSYKNPLFIKMTNDILIWTNVVNDDHIIYKCENHDIEIHIFNTMMPTVQETNNEIIKNLQKTIPSEYDFLKKYIQTINDVIFTNNFYKELEKIMQKTTMTIFSFAVFNQRTSKSSNINYIMFEEIKRITEGNKNVILAEWTYDMDNYNVKVNGKLEYITYASVFKAILGKIKPKIIHIKEKMMELL